MEHTFVSCAKTAELVIREFAEKYFTEPQEVEKVFGDNFTLVETFRIYRVIPNQTKTRWKIIVE